MTSVLKKLKKWIKDKQNDSDGCRDYSARNDYYDGKDTAYDEVIERIDDILSMIGDDKDDS